MTFPAEKQSLVTKNMGLVFNEAYKMIHKYNTPTIDVDDLIQMGSMGLMKAAEKYDPSTGNEFSTYATYYIRGFMMREANRTYGAISGGVHVMMLSRTIKARGQERDDPKELAKVYNYSAGLIKNAQRYARLKTSSIDQQALNNDNEESGHDFYNFKPEIVDFDIGMISNEFLSLLKPKYREIIQEVADGKTLSDIAREWGCKRANVFNMRVVIRKRWEQYEKGDVVSDTRTGRPRKQMIP